MIDGFASMTALRVAMRRAAHQLRDSPLVFVDPLALRVVGAEIAAQLEAETAAPETELLAPFLRAFMAARSRFAEDALASAVNAGARQYVIFGAGLDTFAYRNPHEAEGLRVFEVDFPATQVWKRERLAEARIGIPSSLAFVPVDFERETLAQPLAAAGFKRGEVSFFSWLGVVPYLEQSSIRKTLEFVVDSSRTGSELIFDYAVPPETLNPVQRLVFERVAARVARAGEPWKTFFDPADLKRQLYSIGLDAIEDLDGGKINARFFSGRADGLRVGDVGRLLRARVRADAGSSREGETVGAS